MAQLRSDFQEILQAKEEQEDLLHRKERELNALKGALKDEVETHDNYMAALKDEYEIELKKLLRDFDLAREARGLPFFGSLSDFVLSRCEQFFFSLPEQHSARQREGESGGGRGGGQGAAEGPAAGER